MFQGCFEEVLRVFQESFKDVSRISRVFKCASRKIEECFEDVLRLCERCPDFLDKN